MKDYIFVGFGEVTCDIIYSNDLEIIYREPGGTTFNILSNIARLSKDSRCYALGIYGESEDTNIILRKLRESGINIDHLQKSNKKLNTFHCVIPNELQDVDLKTNKVINSITYSRVSPINGETTYDRSMPINQIIPRQLRNNDIIVVLENFRDGTIPFLKSIEKDRRIIIMDIGRITVFQHLSRDEILEVLHQVNMIQISEVVLEALKEKLEFQDVCELLESCDLDIAILTKGKKGALIYYKDNVESKFVQYNIIKPEEEIDPSGAGDAFLSIAAILYRYYLNRGINIDKKFADDVFLYGNSLARKVIRQIGARCSEETIKQWKKEEKSLIQQDKLEYQI